MAAESRQSVEPRRAELKSPVEARQGVISGRVIVVLVISLLLAIAALGMCYWLSSGR
jgi:hypothetical protein